MAGQMEALVGDVFRQKYRDMTAALTREFGAANLDLIEDAIQDSMIKALQVWSFGDIPGNPGGWLFVAARRSLIDKLRWLARSGTRASDQIDPDQIASTAGNSYKVDPLEDDLLKMTFICCHPEFNPKTQLAMMLKNLCGLGNAEIGHVLLLKEGTVKKALTRAKQRIRQLDIRFEIPEDAVVDDRLDGVLRCVYLMFNEGYMSQGGEELIKESLCRQALSLIRLLLKSRALNDYGKVSALASLLALQASRLPARLDAAQRLLRLDEQDRSRWDKGLIAEGMAHLGRSTETTRRSTYHLQAGIAACHAVARTYDATDWPAILNYYDDLLAMHPSPIVALNRTVAVAMTRGYPEALIELERIECASELSGYYLLPALKADYQQHLGQVEAARASYRLALDLTSGAGSRRFLEEKLAECSLSY